MGKEAGRHLFFRAGSSVFLLFDSEATSQTGAATPSHGAAGSVHACFLVSSKDYQRWKGIPRAASHSDSDRSCMKRGGAQFLLPRSRQQSPRDRERGLLATVRFQGCHPDRCQRLGEALYCASLQRGLPTGMIGLPAILWITPAADQIAGCQNPVRSPKANHQDTEGLVPCGAVRIRTKTIKPQPIRA